MSEKYYLTRRNIDKQENITWKAYDENWGDYIYKCNIDGADEFSLEQIEEMQRENINDFVFDYAYRKEDILKLGKKIIDRKDIINLENFRIVKPNKPKRKPLSDDSLPMTKEELEEFSKIIGKKVTLVEIVNDAIFISYFVESAGDYGGEEISSIKAILYLAERFELIKED